MPEVKALPALTSYHHQTTSADSFPTLLAACPLAWRQTGSEYKHFVSSLSARARLPVDRPERQDCGQRLPLDRQHSTGEWGHTHGDTCSKHEVAHC